MRGPLWASALTRPTAGSARSTLATTNQNLETKGPGAARRRLREKLRQEKERRRGNASTTDGAACDSAPARRPRRACAQFSRSSRSAVSESAIVLSAPTLRSFWKQQVPAWLGYSWNRNRPGKKIFWKGGAKGENHLN